MKLAKKSEIVIDLVKEKMAETAIFFKNDPRFSQGFLETLNDKWVINLSLEYSELKSCWRLMP